MNKSHKITHKNQSYNNPLFPNNLLALNKMRRIDNNSKKTMKYKLIHKINKISENKTNKNIKKVMKLQSLNRKKQNNKSKSPCQIPQLNNLFHSLKRSPLNNNKNNKMT